MRARARRPLAAAASGSPPRSRRIVGLAAACALAATGLRAEEALAEPPATQPEAAGVLPAKRLMPLRRRSMRYALRDGDAERRVGVTLRPADGERQWWLRVGEHRHSLLRRREDGAIEVLRQRLPADGMKLFYEPAALLLPARCEPGETFRSEGRLRIETNSGAVHRGDLVHTVKIVDRIRTEAGGEKLDALLVRTRDEVDLGMVNLTITARTHYVPGRGRAFQRMITERRTLAVFGSTSKERFRVVEWNADLER